MTHFTPASSRRRSILNLPILGLVFGLAGCLAGAHRIETRPIAIDRSSAREMVSAFREVNGLSPVTLSAALDEAAARQARAMAERDRIGHRVAGALPGRLAAAGYVWGATTENLGAGYRNLDAAMQGWRSSPEHRKNLLNPHVTELGVAAFATPPGAKHRTYWALILAAPPPQAAMAGPFQMQAAQ
jgi:uncharacterized protein YkwD